MLLPFFSFRNGNEMSKFSMEESREMKRRSEREMKMWQDWVCLLFSINFSLSLSSYFSFPFIHVNKIQTRKFKYLSLKERKSNGKHKGEKRHFAERLIPHILNSFPLLLPSLSPLFIKLSHSLAHLHGRKAKRTGS